MTDKKVSLPGGIALASGLAMAAGLVLVLMDMVHLWVYEVLLVVLFPVFSLSLGLWWMARKHEPDIPFLGY